MSKISIESREIFAGQDHLYLIFQDSAGLEFVIRGGPEDNNPLDFGDIVTDVNVPIAESEDARGNDTPVERGNREDVYKRQGPSRVCFGASIKLTV